MTSLIDVIFLLLLFFMLTSTFTRFAEVELSAGGAGAGTVDTPPIFVQLRPEGLRINGENVVLEAVAETLTARLATDRDAPVLISLSEGVTAQHLTDALGAMRDIDGLQVTVLGGA